MRYREVKKLVQDITSLNNMTSYKKGTWPQTLSCQSNNPSYCDPYKTLGIIFSLLSSILLYAMETVVTNNSWSCWWQSDIKPVCMQKSDPILLFLSGQQVANWDSHTARLRHWQVEPRTTWGPDGNTCRALVFGISPWEPTFVPEPVSMKILLWATAVLRENVPPVDYCQRYLRKWD